MTGCKADSGAIQTFVDQEHQDPRRTQETRSVGNP